LGIDSFHSAYVLFQSSIFADFVKFSFWQADFLQRSRQLLKKIGLPEAEGKLTKVGEDGALEEDVSGGWSFGRIRKRRMELWENT
jgi:hypothetical protein